MRAQRRGLLIIKAGRPFRSHGAFVLEVAKVNIRSVGQWCTGNVFDEDHAHGVRNLVVNPDLLSELSR